MRIAQIGTFDVENFGDLLFPAIARAGLEHLGVEIVAVSPVGGPAVWDDCVESISLAALDPKSIDGVLLGGGNLIHAGPAGVDRYRRDGTTWLLAYARLWTEAARVAREAGIPLVWNGVGVPGRFSARVGPLLRTAVEAAAYVSVRDEHSADNLRSAGVTAPITVIPDTAFAVSRIFSDEALANAYKRFCSEHGLDSGARIVAMHLNSRYLGEDPSDVAARVDRIASEIESTPVLLALGRCHRDHLTAAEVARSLTLPHVVVERPSSLREIVAVISRAQGYVGSSLHGMITAFAFGRPAVVVAREHEGSGKFTGLLRPFHAEERLVGSWKQAEQRIWLLHDGRDVATVADAARARLDEHWARVAELLMSPGAPSTARVSFPMEVVLEEALDTVARQALRDRDRIAHLQRERRRLAQQRRVEEQRLADVESRLTEQIDERVRLDATIERLTDELAAERTRAEHADGQTAEAARRATEERERAALAEAAAERLRAREETLEAQIGEFKEKLARREDTIAGLEEAASRRQDELVRLKHELQERESQIARLGELLEQRQGEASRLEQLLSGQQEEASRLEALLADWRAEALRFEQEAVRRRADVARLERLVALRDRAHAELQQQVEEIEALRSQLEEQHEAAERWEREAVRLAGELRAVKQRSHDHATLSASRKARIERLERELIEARRDVAARRVQQEQALEHLREVEIVADRLARSTAWRVGHRFARVLRWLSLRPAKGQGAMPLLGRHAALARDTLQPSSPPAEASAAPDRAAADRSAPTQSATSASSLDSAPGVDDRTRPGRAIDDPGEAIPVLRTLRERDRDRVRLVPPRDLRGVLRDGGRTPGVVDVVVCVHDALDDVHRCITSLLERTDRPMHLIVVDDGSGPETADYLDRLVAANPAVALRRNSAPPHGYTIAANIGIRASANDLVVLLNSDTVVTRGWLDHLVDVANADERIGVLGPLSNAATHQSVPRVRDGQRWAVNEPPRWLPDDALALVIAGLPGPDYVDVPFVNGFCYCIKRSVIDAIGVFDEKRFASGYSEENDYSLRAADAGFTLAVATRSYVHHAKSRSYGASERDALAKRNYQTFLKRHGAERVRQLVAELDRDERLHALRGRVEDALASPRAAATVLPRLGVVFVLPGMAKGGSGGSHSIYQEVSAMRSLGFDATIALIERDIKRARAVYPDAADVFMPYRDEDELAGLVADADILVATHFTSAEVVGRIVRERPAMVGAYYVQDYEPLFAPPGSESALIAERSYAEIPDCLLFAKTEWLRDIVREQLGLAIAKVEPSIDHEVFHPRGRTAGDDVVHVIAMVRPRTPRRAPAATLEVLRRVAQEHGARVALTTFGCDVNEFEAFDPHPAIEHRGLLRRDEVAELMRSAHVFVDCSWYQAFGRTGLEAMACGATAVLPQLGGTHEYAVDGENALVVDTWNIDEATAAVSRLVAERGLRRRLQANAAATAARYTCVRAALSEYALFAAEVNRRASLKAASW